MNYEYECSTCNSKYSIERSIHEDTIAPVCVDCHQSMTRVWAIGGISFKGGGFYVNGG